MRVTKGNVMIWNEVYDRAIQMGYTAEEAFKVLLENQKKVDYTSVVDPVRQSGSLITVTLENKVNEIIRLLNAHSLWISDRIKE